MRDVVTACCDRRPHRTTELRAAKRQPDWRLRPAHRQQQEAAGQRGQHRLERPTARLPGLLDAKVRSPHCGRCAAPPWPESCSPSAWSPWWWGQTSQTVPPSAPAPSTPKSRKAQAAAARPLPLAGKGNGQRQARCRSPKGAGEIRIIGGAWKRTRLPVASARACATADRVRESPVQLAGPELPGGWRCLDALPAPARWGLKPPRAAPPACNWWKAMPPWLPSCTPAAAPAGHRTCRVQPRRWRGDPEASRARQPGPGAARPAV